MNPKMKHEEVPKEKPKGINKPECEQVVILIEKKSEQLQVLKMEKTLHCCCVVLHFRNDIFYFNARVLIFLNNSFLPL